MPHRESDPDVRARELAAAALAADDPTAWFARLYADADRGAAVIPWDRAEPHSLLRSWVRERNPAPPGRALIVGCGYGRDAELIAELGFSTTAFDISPSAIRAARARHPKSPVDYRTADLLNLPTDWVEAYDLVVESMTVQALPRSLHGAAIAAIATTVAPGGTLLVIAAGPPATPGDGPPWPLTRADIDAFATGKFTPVRIEEITDGADPTMGRWRAEFTRQR